MKGLDEYTLSELKTSETFTKEQFDKISVRMDKQNVPSSFDFKNSYCEGECYLEIPIGYEFIFVLPRQE